MILTKYGLEINFTVNLIIQVKETTTSTKVYTGKISVSSVYLNTEDMDVQRILEGICFLNI
jgi:hypothetical protein